MTKYFLPKKWIFVSVLGILALILGFGFLGPWEKLVARWNDSPVPYHFESLKNCSDEKIARFMSGTKAVDSFHETGAPDNNFPETFWTADLKKVALAFAEANRSPSHRKNFQLWTDSNPTLTVPAAGWLVLDDFHTQTILRFGIDQPFLLHATASSLGMYGNRYVDGEKHSLQLIPLSKDEAHYLSSVAFWLEHLKSMPTSKDHNYSTISVSHESYGTLEWKIDKQPRHRIEGALWDFPAISARWGSDYGEEVQLNLSYFLFTQALPKHLKKRWEPPTRNDYDSYNLPLSKRINDPDDTATKAKITEVILTALARHEDDPLPSAALIALAKCAGDVGLSETLPALEALTKKLSPPSTDRTTNLVDDSFTQAIRQIHAHDKPAQLRELAQGKDDSAMWALQQLYRLQPDAYAEVLLHRFSTEDARQRSEIFETLAALNPVATRRLLDSLTGKEQAALLLGITEFERTDDPFQAQTRIPALLKILGMPTEKAVGYESYQLASKRASAIEMLAKLPLSPADQHRFEELLFIELTSPEVLETYGKSAISSAATAIVAQPNPDRYWEALYVAASTETGTFEFDSLLNALATLAIAKPKPRLSELAELLRPRFKKHEIQLDTTLLAALALDLRSLASEIEYFATSDPVVPDGEITNSCDNNPDKPCLHRYHSARHISALWQQPDAETRARMWAALLLNSPYDFRGTGTIPSSLRDRCRSAITAVSPKITQKLISKVRVSNDLPLEIKDWLTSFP